MSDNYENWRLETDGEGITWLHFDMAGSGTNVLSSGVFAELTRILDSLHAQPPKGLVILSAKPGGFIAGANVKEFTTIEDRAQALELIRTGQQQLDRIQSLPCPTVARIHGYCVGGGLELALACDYRVALDEPRTRLGLPEVMLGIHPGFGGTVRLPRLIGVPAAMDLMLSGRTVDARRAARMGMVDHAVPERHLDRACRAMVLERPPKKRPSRLLRLADSAPLRPLLAAFLRKQVARRAPKEHYPAPYALIDLWARHGAGSDEMFQAEAESVADLVRTETSRNLVRVFFLQERLKGLGREVEGPATERVHVVGAGVMGGDIAAWCDVRGLTVTLQDREPKYIAPAVKRAYQLFERKFRPRHLRMAARDRLIPDHKGLGVPRADLVIEAIIENREAKQELYRAIEPQLQEHALLATNTSSIPLEELATVLQRPERLVGLHFFNPVAKMQLVEIVRGENTSQESAERAAAFARAIDRLPLPVKSSPGFLVNRILLPYLLEAVELLSEGVPAQTIDRVATRFGMPMGPIRLADTVGLDICLSVATILAEELGATVPQMLREVVGEGRLGVKSGRGFYQYRKGKPVKEPRRQSPVPDQVIEDRLILRLLNECVACLREQVVADEDLLDAGMIFGTGFAPFRGGPLHYLRSRGIEATRRRLEELAGLHGERFRPDPGWEAFSAGEGRG
ncbi:MAG: crotonase [Gammaproteobacteria bacterium]|nr:MAG: crotonase [Gammaproteobacteria bacterium]